MTIRLLLVTILGLVFTSMAFAHPGHEHEIGVFASFIHAIANNGLWLLLFVVIGAIVGYRIVRSL